MEAIKERAKEFSSLDSKLSLALMRKGRYDGYIAGATEQRKIDIDKARKAYCKPCGYVRKGCSCQKFINFLKEIEK